jgi:hypothetical protein
MDEPRRLRELAAWFRQFAERAGAPWIWEARLVTAETLEDEAERLERSGRTNSRGGVRYRSSPR